MPVYAKRTTSSDPIFKNRVQTVATLDKNLQIDSIVSHTPIPDSVTLCNGCNQNVAEGYLVYMDKRHLQLNRPYDYYCDECVKKSFPKAVTV